MSALEQRLGGMGLCHISVNYFGAGDANVQFVEVVRLEKFVSAGLQKGPAPLNVRDLMVIPGNEIQVSKIPHIDGNDDYISIKNQNGDEASYWAASFDANQH
jgi:hypothetical protein